MHIYIGKFLSFFPWDFFDRCSCPTFSFFYFCLFCVENFSSGCVDLGKGERVNVSALPLFARERVLARLHPGS